MMTRDDSSALALSPLSVFTSFALLVLLASGCELGWEEADRPTFNEAASVAAARGVASWAADSSGCNLEVVSVDHVKRFGPLSDLSDEIANNTAVLDGDQGCDAIRTPSEVKSQELYPGGSRSAYREVMEKLLDDSPTDAEHVVRVKWNSPSGSFTTLSAVNADSLKVLFSPVGTLLGSDRADQATDTRRTDSLTDASTPPSTWKPEGDDRERLVWQDSLTTELQGAGTVPIDHGRVLAKTTPEITVDWNADAEVSQPNCTLDGSGIVHDASIEAGVETADFYRKLVKTSTRAQWADGECRVRFRVDVGIAEGAASMSATASGGSTGFDISKSGTGQFWTFRRTYEWAVTP